MSKRARAMYKLIGIVGSLLGAAAFILMPLAGAEYDGGFLKQVVFSFVTCLVSIAGLLLFGILICWSRKKSVPKRYNPWESRIFWLSDR